MNDLRLPTLPVAHLPRCDKACYPDKKAAISQINVVMRRRRNRPDRLRAYHCDDCGGWHLTHQEELD